ncbi:hypothetical protein FB567DRAFT_632262 [Paraphoma chrysanthemicola]|uniref:Uncharacterized protein n=1 Tax=Paraphoma chrysanthemicola TaxID=798071 RepID=A0A8K0R0B4_9PLEO|nr:hypothetical protein FB567DRAFT_632262 [Paraphoma chrysanthemicola]
MLAFFLHKLLPSYQLTEIQGAWHTPKPFTTNICFGFSTHGYGRAYGAARPQKQQSTSRPTPVTQEQTDVPIRQSTSVASTRQLKRHAAAPCIQFTAVNHETRSLHFLLARRKLHTLLEDLGHHVNQITAACYCSRYYSYRTYSGRLHKYAKLGTESNSRKNQGVSPQDRNRWFRATSGGAKDLDPGRGEKARTFHAYSPGLWRRGHIRRPDQSAGRGVDFGDTRSTVDGLLALATPIGGLGRRRSLVHIVTDIRICMHSPVVELVAAKLLDKIFGKALMETWTWAVEILLFSSILGSSQVAIAR